MKSKSAKDNLFIRKFVFISKFADIEGSMVMVKKRGILILGIVILLICLCGVRYYWLNSKYPNPSEISAGFQEPLDLGGYTFELTSWEWGTGEAIKSLLPDYTLIMDEQGKEYPADKEKVAFATVRITKNDEQDNKLDLTNIAIESGAWHDQWDYVVFEALNGNSSLVLSMDKGESYEIIFPIVLYEFQFHSYQWKNVENREFRIVLNNYPEKYFLIKNEGVPVT